MATIDIEKIAGLVASADKIFLSPEAENELVKLLEIQKQVEDAIDQARAKLETAGLATNPNFKSIEGDRVKVSYRAYGSQYYIDDTQLDIAPKELYTVETKTVYKIDSKMVANWVKEHNAMPAGIKEVERVKQLTIKLKNNDVE